MDLTEIQNSLIALNKQISSNSASSSTATTNSTTINSDLNMSDQQYETIFVNTGTKTINIILPLISKSSISHIQIIKIDNGTGIAVVNANTNESIGTFGATFPISSQGQILALQNDGISTWWPQNTGVFVEYASNSSNTNANDSTSFVNSAQGSTGILGVTNLTTDRQKRIRFLRPIQPTDLMIIEIYDPTNGMWVNSYMTPGTYPINTVFVQNSYLGANGGMALAPVNDTDVDVWFMQTPYGNPGHGWAGYGGNRWRVRKISFS